MREGPRTGCSENSQYRGETFFLLLRPPVLFTFPQAGKLSFISLFALLLLFKAFIIIRRRIMSYSNCRRPGTKFLRCRIYGGSLSPGKANRYFWIPHGRDPCAPPAESPTLSPLCTPAIFFPYLHNAFFSAWEVRSNKLGKSSNGVTSFWIGSNWNFQPWPEFRTERGFALITY